MADSIEPTRGTEIEDYRETKEARGCTMLKKKTQTRIEGEKTMPCIGEEAKQPCMEEEKKNKMQPCLKKGIKDKYKKNRRV